MSVHQLKDGRWICQWRDKESGKLKRKYFGRDLDREIQAKDFNDSLRLQNYSNDDDQHQNIQSHQQGNANISTRAETITRNRLIDEHLIKYYDRSEILTEVRTPFGRIDILTPDEIIEVKTIERWREGLGQLKVYEDAYPDRYLHLHLFGKGIKNSYDQFVFIVKVTKSMGITISHAQNYKISWRLHSKLRRQKLDKTEQHISRLEELRKTIMLLPAIKIPDEKLVIKMITNILSN